METIIPPIQESQRTPQTRNMAGGGAESTPRYIKVKILKTTKRTF